MFEWSVEIYFYRNQQIIVLQKNFQPILSLKKIKSQIEIFNLRATSIGKSATHHLRGDKRYIVWRRWCDAASVTPPVRRTWYDAAGETPLAWPRCDAAGVTPIVGRFWIDATGVTLLEWRLTCDTTRLMLMLWRCWCDATLVWPWCDATRVTLLGRRHGRIEQ